MEEVRPVIRKNINPDGGYTLHYDNGDNQTFNSEGQPIDDATGDVIVGATESSDVTTPIVEGSGSESALLNDASEVCTPKLEQIPEFGNNMPLADSMDSSQVIQSELQTEIVKSQMSQTSLTPQEEEKNTSLDSNQSDKSEVITTDTYERQVKNQNEPSPQMDGDLPNDSSVQSPDNSPSVNVPKIEFIRCNQLIERTLITDQFVIKDPKYPIISVEKLSGEAFTLQESSALHAVRLLATRWNYKSASINISDYNKEHPNRYNLKVKSSEYFDAFGVKRKKNGEPSSTPSKSAIDALKSLGNKVQHIKITYFDGGGNELIKEIVEPPILFGGDKVIKRRSSNLDIVLTAYLLLHLDDYFSHVRSDYFKLLLSESRGNESHPLNKLGTYFKVRAGDLTYKERKLKLDLSFNPTSPVGN